MKFFPDILAHKFYFYGITDLLLPKKFLNKKYPHVYLFNYLINKKQGLTLIEKPVEYYNNYFKINFFKKGDKEINQIYSISKNNFNIIEDIYEKIKDVKFPRFVIDIRFTNLLTETELNSLINELEELRVFIRNYFLEESSLYLTSVNIDNQKIKAFRNVYTQGFETVFEKELDKIILLDPLGEEKLEDVIDFNKIYIIGGITDRGNRLKGLTRKLKKGGIISAKIEIFNSPWLISQKIDSIVKSIVYYLYNEVLDMYDAMIVPMNKEEKKRLLNYILQKI